MTAIYRADSPIHSVRIVAGLLSALLLATTAVMATETGATDAGPVAFDIPAQAVPAALSDFAHQARVQLFFISDGYEDVQANAVVGRYTPQRALDMLLAGTGLQASLSAEASVEVRPVSSALNAPTAGLPFVAAAGAPRGNAGGVQARSGENDGGGEEQDRGNPRKLEEVVVTGTSIRGMIPESTPLDIYTEADIRNTGALTIEQFVSTIPQNNNTLTEVGSGSSSREFNGDATSSVDLRGLGVGTTLVLLNGRRMAPSSRGRTVDLSFIPLSAVKRVEVLTDGASAIYGADAIGGVVNIVLKDGQAGTETAVTVGGARGGSETLRIDQSFAMNWPSGDALLALSYMDRNDLDAADREYSRAAAPLSLVPEDTRRHVLLSVSQNLPHGFAIAGDVLYSDRNPHTVLTQSLAGNRLLESSIDHRQTVSNLSISRPIGDRLNAEILLTYAEAGSDERGYRTEPDPADSGASYRQDDTSTLDVTAKLDGTLATLPGGDALFALGAGYLHDEYEKYLDFTDVGGPEGTTALDRNTRYAFAELLIPLASARQNVPGIDSLELSLAARYTDYSGYGDNTSPKIGLHWAPTSSVGIRGTFGESFKAPFLVQLDPTVGNALLFRPADLGFPDTWTTDGSAVLLFAQGPGNPDLQAEKAQTYTLGLDVEFSVLTFSATYYDINYTDRIAEPDSSGGFVVLGSPEDYPEFFDTEPTLQQVEQILANSVNFNLTELDMNDPAAVHAATAALFDNRIQNLSVSHMDGIDLKIDYSPSTALGEVNIGIKASKILEFDERLTPQTSPITKVDTVLYPADLKVFGYIGLQRKQWSTRLNVRYVDEYENPFDTGNPDIEDWTTVDFLLTYEFSNDVHRFWRDVRLALTVQNAFDEDPPFVTMGSTTNTSLLEPTGFDPANADPIGRFISFQFSRKW